VIEPHLKFIGADYEPGATGPERYDCSGVCGAYLEALGLKVPAGGVPGHRRGRLEAARLAR